MSNQSGWQPIETAPKDGTRVLIASFNGAAYQWAYVAWFKGRHWRFRETMTGSYQSVDTPATHWQPLPPPPENV